MPFAFVAISIGALAGVPDQEAGLASGINNTALQIGGALGVAALSAIAISRTEDLVGAGTPQPNALTEGFQAALWAGVGVAILGLVASIALVKDERGAVPEGVALERG